MATGRIRVGVVGTSWWADLEHLPGLRARGDVEVAALCGRDPERLRALAAKHGVPRTESDWRALVQGGGLDALGVAAPGGELRRVEDALRAGGEAGEERGRVVRVGDAAVPRQRRHLPLGGHRDEVADPPAREIDHV